MVAAPEVDIQVKPSGAFHQAVFSPDEIGWLSNEARILRTFAGHEVWIADPDIAASPFRRLAYHPRLASAVAGAAAGKLAEGALAVENTIMLYARRGIISPSVPYWRRAEPEEGRSSALALVFLADASLGISHRGEEGPRTVEGSIGDVMTFASADSRFTATTEGHLAPLFLVRFAPGIVRQRGGHRVGVPRLADDCLWQPAYWTAG